MEIQMDRPKLYHGTLAANLPSILAEGLRPTVGAFTQGVYGKDASGVVPAVFACADGEDMTRVVAAVVAAIAEDVDEADFEEWDVGPDHTLNDAMFERYGAILEMDAGPQWMQAGTSVGTTEPAQVEDGDWFCLDTVRDLRVLTGEEMMAFLSDRNCIPSDVNDFVDETRMHATTRRMSMEHVG
jgi:hypothetical protein